MFINSYMLPNMYNYANLFYKFLYKSICYIYILFNYLFRVLHIKKKREKEKEKSGDNLIDSYLCIFPLLHHSFYATRFQELH